MREFDITSSDFRTSVDSVAGHLNFKLSSFSCEPKVTLGVQDGCWSTINEDCPIYF